MMSKFISIATIACFLPVGQSLGIKPQLLKRGPQPDEKHFPPNFQEVQVAQATYPTFPFAAFGDSYASGVTYYNGFGGENLDYDAGDPDLVGRCRRIKDAYSVQLMQDFDWNKPDQSWTGGKVPFLWFVACSGSRFGDIPGQIMDLDNQIKGFNDPRFPDVVPKFATLTIGGNDAKFFDVVTSCVYHQDRSRDYGPDFPDPKSACAEAIAASYGVLNDAARFAKPLTSVISNILQYDRVKDDSNFTLLVTGYARFFNQDDPACDNYRFLDIVGPLIKRDMRKAVNDLVAFANKKFGDIITDLIDQGESKVAFVPFDKTFDGHRFCEPVSRQGTGNFDQRVNSNFWSFSILDNYLQSSDANTPCDPEADPNCASPMAGNPKYDYEISGEAGDGFTTSSGDIGATASATRVFHPKRYGFTGIEGFLKEAISIVVRPKVH